ncbi:MAG: hypothetical protein QXP20_03735, partial [Candidatus Bathyarchaeia archaeon]
TEINVTALKKVDFPTFVFPTIPTIISSHRIMLKYGMRRIEVFIQSHWLLGLVVNVNAIAAEKVMSCLKCQR